MLSDVFLNDSFHEGERTNKNNKEFKMRISSEMDVLLNELVSRGRIENKSQFVKELILASPEIQELVAEIDEAQQKLMKDYPLLMQMNRELTHPIVKECQAAVLKRHHSQKEEREVNRTSIDPILRAFDLIYDRKIHFSLRQKYPSINDHKYLNTNHMKQMIASIELKLKEGSFNFDTQETGAICYHLLLATMAEFYVKIEETSQLKEFFEKAIPPLVEILVRTNQTGIFKKDSSLFVFSRELIKALLSDEFKLLRNALNVNLFRIGCPNVEDLFNLATGKNPQPIIEPNPSNQNVFPDEAFDFLDFLNNASL